MKKYGFGILILSAFIVIAMLMTACGENDSDKEVDLSATKSSNVEPSTADRETTAILSTTAEGGTIEQDSDGYKITRDNSGKVVKVEDKNGNPVSVETYLITHTWVENPGSVGGRSDSSTADSNSADGNGNNSDTENNAADGSKNSSKDSASGDDKDTEKSNDNVQPTDANGEPIEESIPVIIATLPDDDDDIVVLPDF